MTMSKINILGDVITPRFTEERLSEIGEWFDKNSQSILLINTDESIQVITTEQLLQFLELRKFHKRDFYYPTYGEVMVEVEKLKAGLSRVLTKAQFLFLLDKWVIEASLKHELKLAFKVFDSENRNFLDVDEIGLIVTGFGEPFNETEVLEFLRDANVRGDGNVFYEDFVESLFNLAPELYDIKVDFLFVEPTEDPSVSHTILQ